VLDTAGDSITVRSFFDARDEHFAMQVYISRTEAEIFGGNGQNAVQRFSGCERLADHAVKPGAAQVEGFAVVRLRRASPVKSQGTSQHHPRPRPPFGIVSHSELGQSLQEKIIRWRPESDRAKPWPAVHLSRHRRQEPIPLAFTARRAAAIATLSVFLLISLNMSASMGYSENTVVSRAGAGSRRFVNLASGGGE
jgi:hypothetical protein